MRRACGELSLDRLAQQPMDEAGAVHFLKFTAEEGPGPSQADAATVPQTREGPQGVD